MDISLFYDALHYNVTQNRIISFLNIFGFST